MLVTALGACAGGSTAQAHAAPIPAEPTPAATGPSERDCDELITHAVALGIDESAGSGAAATTQADHEAVRRTLREEFMTGCRALTADAFRCALAAPSLAALGACQPPK